MMSELKTFLLAFPPGLYLIFSGMIISLTRGEIFKVVVMFLSVFGMVLTCSAASIDNKFIIRMGEFSLNLMHNHSYSLIFGTAFNLALILASLFALQNRKEITIGFIYAGCAVSICFCGDLISLFLFWEIMAITSSIIIFKGGNKSAKAGLRYLNMHLIGGAILLVAIIWQINLSGTTQIPSLQVNIEDFKTIALDNKLILLNLLFLAGILVNIAAPPFSAWVADSYSTASYSGSVFLSSFTTKASIFVLITCFGGSNILIYIGILMISYGIIYSIIENDIRKILSYSIIAQLGFMASMAGIGTDLALFGASVHAFAHIIYKALLFMTAGAVILQTGKYKLTELGGICRSMPLTNLCMIVGGLAASAFPMTSAYVSKALMSEAANEANFQLLYYFMLAAASVTFLYLGLNFPYSIFFGKDSGLRPKDPEINMQIAMVIAALLCIIPGINPGLLLSLLPENIDISFYEPLYLIRNLQLLLFSALAFILLIPFLEAKESLNLDIDWVYRVLLPKINSLVINILYKLSNSLALINNMAFSKFSAVSNCLLNLRYTSSTNLQILTASVIILIILYLN